MKLKLRKIGNSLGVLIPREAILSYNAGDEIEVEVITKEAKLDNLRHLMAQSYNKAEEKPADVITEIELEPDDSVKKQVEFIN